MSHALHHLARAATISLVLLLAACGQKLEGVYTDPVGLSKYEFAPGGKVYFSLMGTRTEMKYEIDGKNVKIYNEMGNQVFTLLEDGSLQGPMNIKLTKLPKP